MNAGEGRKATSGLSAVAQHGVCHTCCPGRGVEGEGECRKVERYCTIIFMHNINLILRWYKGAIII